MGVKLSFCITWIQKRLSLAFCGRGQRTEHLESGQWQGKWTERCDRGIREYGEHPKETACDRQGDGESVWMLPLTVSLLCDLQLVPYLSEFQCPPRMHQLQSQKPFELPGSPDVYSQTLECLAGEARSTCPRICVLSWWPATIRRT